MQQNNNRRKTNNSSLSIVDGKFSVYSICEINNEIRIINISNV